ncbi:hypothetical protein PLICRDRAFT_243049 [Plicaturopsis crispa FD-325 SS-3]|nr:hypothetical protein PLICRDRAFT_243049 [Plicaturopsis crispa FD-325 SS-3]
MRAHRWLCLLLGHRHREQVSYLHSPVGATEHCSESPARLGCGVWWGEWRDERRLLVAVWQVFHFFLKHTARYSRLARARGRAPQDCQEAAVPLVFDTAARSSGLPLTCPRKGLGSPGICSVPRPTYRNTMTSRLGSSHPHSIGLASYGAPMHVWDALRKAMRGVASSTTKCVVLSIGSILSSGPKFIFGGVYPSPNFQSRSSVSVSFLRPLPPPAFCVRSAWLLICYTVMGIVIFSCRPGYLRAVHCTPPWNFAVFPMGRTPQKTAAAGLVVKGEYPGTVSSL